MDDTAEPGRPTRSNFEAGHGPGAGDHCPGAAPASGAGRDAALAHQRAGHQPIVLRRPGGQLRVRAGALRERGVAADSTAALRKQDTLCKEAAEAEMRERRATCLGEGLPRQPGETASEPGICQRARAKAFP
jgi:hypothetical protein